MSELKWKDESSWARSDSETDRKTPKLVVCRLPSGVRVSVHRHIHYPGKWVMSVNGGPMGFNFGPKELKSVHLDAAQNEAIDLYAALLETLVREVSPRPKKG